MCVCLCIMCLCCVCDVCVCVCVCAGVQPGMFYTEAVLVFTLTVVLLVNYFQTEMNQWGCHRRIYTCYIMLHTHAFIHTHLDPHTSTHGKCPNVESTN